MPISQGYSTAGLGSRALAVIEAMIPEATGVKIDEERTQQPKSPSRKKSKRVRRTGAAVT